jgi:PKD repeat protein
VVDEGDWRGRAVFVRADIPNEPPTALFTRTCTELACSFDATSSTDPDGTIASYAWDFGDGTTGSGLNVQHTYALPSGYNVTLVVTDNTGHVGVNTQTVSVASSNPTAAFSITPQSPHTTDVISLDGSGSSAVLGRVIVTYAWEFSGAFVGTASGSAVSVGPVGGSGGTLTIKLTVTDSAGQIGILSKTIQIQP